MNKLLLAGLASATAFATVTPAQAHPNWHYSGGCDFFATSDGTSWEAEVEVFAIATDAAGGLAPTASISVDCELRINGSTYGIVYSCTTPGTGFVACAGRFSFNADSDDVVTMCEIVTVNGESHKSCDVQNQPPIVPQPVQDLIDSVAGSCHDGSDNDGDGRTDLADPGCAHHADPDERGITACDDGLDNDLDGWADAADSECTDPADTDEGSAGGGLVGCDDGLDNDADGQSDSADPGCADRSDPDERGTTACDDGADNDGDLRSDYPADPGCTGPADTDEAGPSACADGIDNDGDLAADTSDPGCSGPSDTDERGTAGCDDGADNDADGAADYPQDTGCDGPADGSERSATFPCDDGADNDNDGFTDYPADPGCRTATDPNETTIP